MSSVVRPAEPTPAPPVVVRRRAGPVRKVNRVIQAKAFKTPIPVLLLVFALVMPQEVHTDLGGIRIDAPRAVIITFFFPALLKLIQRRLGGVIPTDYLFAFWGFWVVVAMSFNHDFAQAVEWGGAYFLESFGGYLITRAYLRNTKQFLSFVKLFIGTVLVLFFFNTFEALTEKHVIRDFARSILGGTPPGWINKRFGLERAYGPFPHPILNGVYCGSALGLSWCALSRSHRWTFQSVGRSAVVAWTAAMSVSSGAVAMIGIQGLIIFWRRITEGVHNRWKLLLGILGTFYVVVGFVSNRPALRVMLYYLTFSPTTAYNRMIIWERGSLSVLMNPVFGIGFHEWDHPSWMSNSMDAFWLVVFAMYGIPAGFCLVYGCYYVVKHVGKAITGTTQEDMMRLGWMTTFGGLALAGVTVHFWNQSFVWFCAFMGSGVCLFLPEGGIGGHQGRRRGS